MIFFLHPRYMDFLKPTWVLLSHTLLKADLLIFCSLSIWSRVLCFLSEDAQHPLQWLHFKSNPNQHLLLWQIRAVGLWWTVLKIGPSSLLISPLLRCKQMAKPLLALPPSTSCLMESKALLHAHIFIARHSPSQKWGLLYI